MVKETLSGDHGNGEARKKKLGKYWQPVMDVINGKSTAPKPTPKPQPATFKVGDRVKTNARKDIHGTTLASFINKNYYVIAQVGRNGNNNHILLKGINTWVEKSTLTK